MNKIGIFVPVYNEENNIDMFYKEINNHLLNLTKKYEIKVYYIDDGSKDNSWEQITSLIESKKNEKIRVGGVKFSRNFGKESAIACSINKSILNNYDAIVIIDCDLQHPVEIIKEFIIAYEDGYNVVLTKRKGSQGLIRDLFSSLFYYIMSLFSEIKYEKNLTDFCFLSKTALNYIQKITEKKRFFKGILLWLGFKRKIIEFNVRKRILGSSSFNIFSLFSLFLNSFLSFSIIPLKISTFIFLIGSILIFFKNIILVYFLLLIGLSILSIYLGKIYYETRGRPLFVIEDEKN